MTETRIGEGDPPPCSRCGAQTLMVMQTPQEMGRVLLELCPACDGEKPAAGEWLRFVTGGGLRMTEAPSELEQARVQRLLDGWVREAMAERGWARVDGPPTSAN